MSGSSATKLQDALVAAGLGQGSDLFAELPAEARAALEVVLSYEEAPVLPAADAGAAAEAVAKAEAKAAKEAKKEAKKAEKEAKKAAAAQEEADAKATAKDEKKAAKAAKKAAKKAAEEEAAAAAAAATAEAKPVKKKKKKKKAEEEDGAAADVAATPAKKKKKKKKAEADEDETPAKTKTGKKKKKKVTEDVTASVKKTAKKSGKKSFLRVIGAGTGGIAEMQSKLANDQTYYGLLRFDVGSGSFVRTKRIFVHFTGDDCAAKTRNKAAHAKGKVKGLLGQTHADMVLTDAAECEIEQIGDRFSTLFASDHGDFDVGALKADYEAMISTMFGASVKDKLKKLAKSRKTAAELVEDGRSIPGKKALAAVRDPMGPFNWIILEPHATKVKMINAGSLSVDEMDKWLKPDYCAAVLLRMGFGSGPFRRTKWIACWWTPDGLSPMKRGKAMGLKKKMMSLLEPCVLFCLCRARASPCARRTRSRRERSRALPVALRPSPIPHSLSLPPLPQVLDHNRGDGQIRAQTRDDYREGEGGGAGRPPRTQRRRRRRSGRLFSRVVPSGSR
jgi:hypothetical protein